MFENDLNMTRMILILFCCVLNTLGFIEDEPHSTFDEFETLWNHVVSSEALWLVEVDSRNMMQNIDQFLTSGILIDNGQRKSSKGWRRYGNWNWYEEIRSIYKNINVLHTSLCSADQWLHSLCQTWNINRFTKSPTLPSNHSKTCINLTPTMASMSQPTTHLNTENLRFKKEELHQSTSLRM